MKALVLAAGEGTRLRPLTTRLPKPMLPVDGKPLLARHVELLRNHGVEEIAINLHHCPEMITRHFGDGSDLGVRIAYSYEETLLGSAGAAKRLEAFFDGAFFVLYGDVLTDLDLTALAKFHGSAGAIATIAVYEVDDPSRCGIVQVDRAGRVQRFVEKPMSGQISGSLASAGIYCLEPEVLSFVSDGVCTDFGTNVFPALLDAGETIVAYHDPETYYLDIGSVDRYQQAERDVREGRLEVAACS